MSLLMSIWSRVKTATERRLFSEYGAVFTTSAVPPPVIVFKDAAEVDAFQSTLSTRAARIGEHQITLQDPAMNALLEAGARAKQEGSSLSARASDSGARGYDDTVRLWIRNINRGLEHWGERGRLSAPEADAVRGLDPADQVPVILGLEDERSLFFGTYFDRSILSSVAAPGASQHLSLLAFDVMEYQDSRIEQLLNSCGWYRTVQNDLPHFTYLGHSAEKLKGLGLKKVQRDYGETTYAFWIPEIS
jgi:hypothetical protein